MALFPGRSRTIVENPRISRDAAESSHRSRSFLDKILNRKKKNDVQLDEVREIDRDIEIFRNKHLDLLNPRVLYKTGQWTFRTGFFRHYREVKVGCSKDESINLNLIGPESARSLRQKNNYRLAHLGLIVIGIKGLTRKYVGAKALIVIYDDRWTDVKKSIIGVTEVDMNENKGIFYCSPDFMLDVTEFSKHIKIGIQTKGYEDYKGNNLLLCVGFIGKLLENCNSRFKVKLADVVELMGNKGIRLIKPLKYSPDDLAGLEWSSDSFTKESVLVPETANMYTNSKGETCIRFTEDLAGSEWSLDSLFAKESVLVPETANV